MQDQKDESSTIKEDFKSEIKNIFDDLSSKYDRVVKSYDSEAPQNFEKVISSIAKIISTYWDIPPKIIVEDLNTEKIRQEKNKVGIPDIPTYQIRFALEEGSWIIFLRDYYRSQIKDHFNRLLSLEELIWDTGGSSLEDLAYYLIEIDQIAYSYVKPVIKLWKDEHDYGSIEEVGAFLIASYHQTSIRMGRIMFEGGKRILKSKLAKLESVQQLKYSSSWSKQAKSIADNLKKDFEEEEQFSIDTYYFIITISIFQREIILENQTQETQTTSNENDSENLWEFLDPEDHEKRALFKEKVILMLYQQQEPDPIDAMNNVVDLVFENTGLAPDQIQDFKKTLIQQIRFKRSKIENKDNERIIVELIQDLLPKQLIEKKKELHHQNVTDGKYQDIEELEIWTYLSDNLIRLKRLDDYEQAKRITQKAISMVYNSLIKLKIKPLNASEKIISKIGNEINLPKDSLQNTIKDIRLKLEEHRDPTKIRELESLIVGEIVEMTLKQFNSVR